MASSMKRLLAIGFDELAMANMPSCAVPCFNRQRPSGCSVTDVACNCRSETFFTPLLVCIGQNCTSADATTAENLYVQVCNDAITSASLYPATPSPSIYVPSLLNSSSKSPSLIGILVGSIAGGFLLISIVGFALWWIVRKDRLRKQAKEWEIDPSEVKPDDVGPSPTPFYPARVSQPHVVPFPRPSVITDIRRPSNATTSSTTSDAPLLARPTLSITTSNLNQHNPRPSRPNQRTSEALPPAQEEPPDPLAPSPVPSQPPPPYQPRRISVPIPPPGAAPLPCSPPATADLSFLSL